MSPPSASDPFAGACRLGTKEKHSMVPALFSLSAATWIPDFWPLKITLPSAFLPNITTVRSLPAGTEEMVP
jgi:hypothetical protein